LTLSHAIDMEKFDNMQSTDIEELRTETSLDDDEQIELTNCCGSDDLDYEHQDTSEINTLTVDLIEKGLQFANNIKRHFLNHDSELE